MTGFALAAAITGFVILPNSVEIVDKPQNQVIVNLNYLHKWWKI